jgi:hypothetical protein
MLSLSATAHAQSAEAGGSLSLSTASGAEGASDASAQGAPAAPAAAEAESAPLSEEQRRARQLRAGASYFGPVGGIYVIDAGSGAPGSFRLNLTTDFFVKKDHLQKNDTNRYFGSVLALGVTPIEHLELSAAVTTRSNRNDAYTPDVVQAVGDLHFDVKGYATLTPGLHLGGDVMLSFLNDQDDAGIAFDATGVGLRANLSFDFRELADDVPLQMRVNAGYVFDNSTKTVSKLEAARFANLQANGQTRATDPSDDYYHYVDRRERLALGINRVDRVALALGLEVPLEVGDSAAIHPLAEWSFDVPVNRQDFDCPLVVDGTGKRAAGTDSCLDVEGIDTWPQHLTVGARAWPVKGLNLLAAVDIGLSGTSRYVQELAPTPPYRIILGAGYTVDARDKPPQVVVKEVEKTVEVNAHGSDSRHDRRAGRQHRGRRRQDLVPRHRHEPRARRRRRHLRQLRLPARQRGCRHRSGGLSRRHLHHRDSRGGRRRGAHLRPRGPAPRGLGEGPSARSRAGAARRGADPAHGP